MTSVDQLGSLSIKLTVAGDETVSASLGKIKSSAIDADVYAVGVSIAGLTEYTLASLTRSEKTLLND